MLLLATFVGVTTVAQRNYITSNRWLLIAHRQPWGGDSWSGHPLISHDGSLLTSATNQCRRHGAHQPPPEVKAAEQTSVQWASLATSLMFFWLEFRDMAALPQGSVGDVVCLVARKKRKTVLARNDPFLS